MTLKPSFRRLTFRKPNASVLLFIATVVAVILANTPLKGLYNQFLSIPVDFSFSGINIFSHHGHPMTVLEFVNDALMAIFFFVIGLEIKQEMLIGELSSARKAMLPVIAAFGGMIVPVLLYVMVCHTQPEMRGAAIPMATDIAFALAVLGALGKRVPISLKVFLTALAVVDDIGGIIVIALFYSSHIDFIPLLIAFGFLLLIYGGGKLRINYNLFYYLGLFIVWMLFVKSGIHPTIAGVAVAFTVPGRPIIDLDKFTGEVSGYVGHLDTRMVKKSNRATVLTPTQVHIVNNIHTITNQAVSPLQKIAEKLTPFVNYLILPLFAFVNAGVTFGGFSANVLLGIPMAIFLGLFVGKSIGIFTFSFAAIKMGLGSMPQGMNRHNLFGISILGGIGFTVSLFIANLSFASLEGGAVLLNEAKLGIFAGSIASGVMGYLFLKREKK